MRTRKILNTLLTLIAMAMLTVCKVASAGASLSFSYPSGFAGASSAFGTGSSGTFDGSVFELTPGVVAHQAGALWYKTQQNIQSFTTDFTFQIAPAVTTVPATACISFIVQNTNSTTNPLAYGSGASADANLCGYGAYTGLGAAQSQWPIYNSIAVKFDISGSGANNYPPGGYPNATGLYINGGPWSGLTPIQDLNPTGVNLNLGHIMDAHMVYDGNLLTMVLRDTETNAQARYTWPLNIPAAIGSNTAWVGFGGGQVSKQALDILSWSFWAGYDARLATPTYSILSGSYPSAQTVSIAGPSGATIYYSTNGLPPTSSSTKYTGPITVSGNQVIQAVAIQSGYTDSYIATANYQINTSNVINFPSGFANASGQVIPVGYAKFTGPSIQLTDTNNAGLEAGAAWYAVPVNVTGFSTNFTLQVTGSNPANGMTFCIQNQTPASLDAKTLLVSGGPTALGESQSGLGYSGSTGNVGGQISGLLSSVAIKFDLYTSPGNTTGLYTNGADTSGAGPQVPITGGVNLSSGHPLNVSLTYNGTTLAMTITDTVTKSVFSHNWTINIPATVGGNTAYVGFTGATGGQFANQYVSSWTYSTSAVSPAVPAAPTNLRVQ